MKYHKKQLATQPVRITSGIFRSRKLQSPGVAHPMGAREKLALFNSLGGHLQNATVLDVYAGSGALGVEALSRRAASATFVEQDASAVKVIKENLKALGLFAPVVKVIKSSAQNYTPESQTYDIIFLDPPYDNYHPEDFAHLPKALKPGGLLALSYPGPAAPPLLDMKLLSDKKYARCHIALYRNL